MANLAASAVTLLNGWPVRHSGRNYSLREFDMVLTGQGGLTNKITAASLGFSKLYASHAAIMVLPTPNGAIVQTSVSLDGSFLILLAPDSNLPADHTGCTLRVQVGGQ